MWAWNQTKLGNEPKFAGRLPLKLLVAILMFRNAVILGSVDGRAPVKLLLLMCRSVRAVRLPISAGKDPMSLLFGSRTWVIRPPEIVTPNHVARFVLVSQPVLLVHVAPEVFECSATRASHSAHGTLVWVVHPAHGV